MSGNSQPSNRDLGSSLSNKNEATTQKPKRPKPILTEIQSFRSSIGRPSPINMDQTSRKMDQSQNAISPISSRLNFSLHRTNKIRQQTDKKTQEDSKKMSMMTDETTPKAGRANQRRLYSTNGRAEFHSPYMGSREKSGDRMDRSNLRIRVKSRSSQKVQPGPKQLTIAPQIKKSLDPIESIPQDDSVELVDTQVKKANNEHGLSEKEVQIFGDRFPEKFIKVRLLGKGGFSLVWLGVHRKKKKAFAVKQIITKNGHQTHLKQIWLGSFFFEQGGHAREQFEKHAGIEHLGRMYAYDIRPDDTWVFYQLCQCTLGSALYSLKASIVNGRKHYKIVYKDYYSKFMDSDKQLLKLIKEMCRVLLLLSEHNIVHSDIKTQNILMAKTEQGLTYKLFDYGSSFLFSNLKQFTMATPEYMAPEILNFILYQNQMNYDHNELKIIKDYRNESAIDIWSLGCIVLEIIHGVPLWLGQHSEVHTKNQVYKGVKGLLSVEDRNFQKIIKLQKFVISRLSQVMKKDSISGIPITKEIEYLLKGMLQLDPNRRLKPGEILSYLGEPSHYPRVYVQDSKQM